jgi:DNA-binding transcriptional LysR family regulator
LAGTALVTREAGSGTRSALEAAIAGALGAGTECSAPVAEFGTATAVREAVRAGLAPAVLSDLTVADDLASGRLVQVRTTGLDLHRELRAGWIGADTPPPGPARDLIAIACSSPR